MFHGFKEGEYIVCTACGEYALGRIKVLCDSCAYVIYTTGETTVRTSYEQMHKLANADCILDTTLGRRNYYSFMLEKFGNAHLTGFAYLASCCAWYANGVQDIRHMYTFVANKHSTSKGAVERNIRTYIEHIKEWPEDIPRPDTLSNKKVIAAIAHAAGGCIPT